MAGFFIIVALILAVAIPLAIAHAKKTNDAWSAAGRQLGLRFTPSGFLQRQRLEGHVRDMHVVIDTYSRGSGKNSTTYTRFRVSFPKSLGLGLQLNREGFFAGVSKLFGSQDIQVGDPAFDQALIVKGNREQSIRSFLTPARRMRIQRFMAWRHENTIDDQSIQCAKRGVPSNSSSIVSTVQTMLRIAWHLTGERENDGRLQQAMQLQNQGDPEKALEVIVATVLESPDAGNTEDEKAGFVREPVEERLVEGELRYLAGDPERAHEVFQKLHEFDPDDKEVLSWLEITGGQNTRPTARDIVQPPPTDIPTTKPEVEPPEKPTSGQGGESLTHAASNSNRPVQQSTFCDALFGAEARSFDVTRRFEESFQGRRVEWEGELQKVEPNYSSFIFRDAEGAKATLKIDERPSPYYGTDDVLAVIHLPESILEALKDRVGERVQFSGELVRADGLMRNVYLDSANIDSTLGSA